MYETRGSSLVWMLIDEFTCSCAYWRQAWPRMGWSGLTWLCRLLLTTTGRKHVMRHCCVSGTMSSTTEKCQRTSTNHIECCFIVCSNFLTVMVNWIFMVVLPKSPSAEMHAQDLLWVIHRWAPSPLTWKQRYLGAGCRTWASAALMYLWVKQVAHWFWRRRKLGTVCICMNMQRTHLFSKCSRTIKFKQ